MVASTHWVGWYYFNICLAIAPLCTLANLSFAYLRIANL